MIFRQSPDGRYYSPIDDSCISQANDGDLLVAHRAISLLSLRVVWSLTGNPPCDHVRVRHCCVHLNPPQISLRGVVRTRGIKYNWFNVVLSFLTMGLALYLMFFVQF